jgi:hypothetical protein
MTLIVVAALILFMVLEYFGLLVDYGFDPSKRIGWEM